MWRPALFEYDIGAVGSCFIIVSFFVFRLVSYFDFSCENVSLTASYTGQ